MRMEFGAWLAAEVAQALGGRTNLPSRKELATRNTSMLSPATRAAVLKLAAK
jgi:sulfofructose kinase